MKSSQQRAMLLAMALVFCGVTVSVQGAACSVKPIGLRCEYLTDPLGIDVLQPRLSWKLEAADASARGQRQTAYRVLVATSAALLAQGESDL